MKILEVIPIARGLAREVLTYWSPEGAARGSIVFVPLRNRVVPSVVLRESSAEDMRSKIRSSEFRLRKVAARAPIPLFSPALIKAAQEVALETASTTGAVLASLLPAALMESLPRLKLPAERFSAPLPKLVGEQLIFQAQEQDRLFRYRTVIREAFARGESVFLAVPTIVDTERMHEELARGIEEHTFVFHSGLGKKELRERFAAALRETHPVLIIGTGSFVLVERPDLKTIILEREHARAYKSPARPFLDLRLMLERYALARGIRIIYGDMPLRVETLWRYEAHELSELVSPSFRLLNAAPSAIIDMRRNERLPGSTFKIISDELRELLAESLPRGERWLIFAARRGLAPITVCQDCGAVVQASDGTSSMTLRKGPRGNVFVSHVTGEMRDANERCRVCESWRLKALGIGIERIEEELLKLFPSVRRFRIDQDTTKTHRQITQEVARFYAAPGSILLATERVLGYFSEPVENSAVISVDALLSLPEWKIAERVFALLLRIREITSKHYLVQTRKTDQDIMRQALEGNVLDFYRSEIKLREALGYPPFATLVKFSVAGTLPRVSSEMEALLSRLERFGIEHYPAPLHVGRQHYRFNALIRVPREAWPHPELLAEIAALPPQIAVDINPEQLL